MSGFCGHGTEDRAQEYVYALEGDIRDKDKRIAELETALAAEKARADKAKAELQELGERVTQSMVPKKENNDLYDNYDAILRVAKEMREWVSHKHPPEYYEGTVCEACAFDELVGKGAK